MFCLSNRLPASSRVKRSREDEKSDSVERVVSLVIAFLTAVFGGKTVSAGGDGMCVGREALLEGVAESRSRNFEKIFSLTR